MSKKDVPTTGVKRSKSRTVTGSKTINLIENGVFMEPINSTTLVQLTLSVLL